MQRNSGRMQLLGDVLLILLLIGCSSTGSSPSLPPSNTDTDIPTAKSTIDSGKQHHLWGLWQFCVDPERETVDVVQLRSVGHHLNALPFLEPPPLKYLTLEGLVFGDCNVTADIGLTHPLGGLTEFTGFDVCGIVITNASVITSYGDGITIAGWNDITLTNADGYSRWWNPAEFPHAKVYGYSDGLLGTSDSEADYICNINPYKYYADGLDLNDDLSSLPTDSRGVFSAGAKNVRRYTIEFGGNLFFFNYAIDACWEPPEGQAPWTVPDDFPETANRSAPYRIDVDVVSNSLFYEDYPPGGGGSITLDVTLYDWFNAGSDKLECRSTCGFPTVTLETPTETGDGYASFQFTLQGTDLIHRGPSDLLFVCRSEDVGYQEFLPAEPVSSYFKYRLNIEDPTQDNGWVYNWDYSFLAKANAIATDWLGNVYFTGCKPDDVQGLSWSTFVIKLNPDGVLLWDFVIGSPEEGNIYGENILVDDMSYIYIAGEFRGTADFDPGAAVHELSSNGGKDIFLCKYTGTGNFIWGKSIGSENADYLNGLVLYGFDYFYITGISRGTIDMDPGPASDVHESGAFIAKFDLNGNHIWARNWGYMDWAIPNAIAVGNWGAAYVIGQFGGTIDFNPGPATKEYISNGDLDIFGSMFSPSGAWLGTLTMGGPKNDRGDFITIDASGNLYLLGNFKETVDLNPGPGTEWHTAIGDHEDIFLCKLYPGGDLSWVNTWDARTMERNEGISVDPLGYIYVTGYFKGMADFNPGIDSWVLAARGEEDCFLVKFDPDGSFIWVRNWGAELSDHGFSITVDDSGSLYMTGHHGRTVDFDPGPLTNYHKAGGNPLFNGNAFVLKVLADGYW